MNRPPGGPWMYGPLTSALPSGAGVTVASSVQVASGASPGMTPSSSSRLPRRCTPTWMPPYPSGRSRLGPHELPGRSVPSILISTRPLCARSGQQALPGRTLGPFRCSSAGGGLVDEIGEAGKDAGVGLGKHAVAQVEDVAAGEHPAAGD